MLHGCLVALLLSLLIPSLAVAQHQVHPAWGVEVVLPKAFGGAARGNLGPTLASQSDGTITILFHETLGPTTGVYVTQSTDEGATWASPWAFPPSSNPYAGPVVATDGADRLHAVWIDGPPFAVYHSRSVNGVNWSPTGASVSDSSAVVLGGPMITIDRLDRIHVFWHLGDYNAPVGPSDTYYAQSSDGGNTWISPVRLSHTDSYHSLYPRADLSGVVGDTLAVFWRDTRENVCGTDVDTYMAYSIDGGMSWTERPAFGGGVIDCDRDMDPVCLVDSHGWIHGAYSHKPNGDYVDGSRIRYGVSKDLGATWQNVIVVSDTVRSDYAYYVNDPWNDIIWLFWQDYRDAVLGGSPAKDLAGKYLLPGGTIWSEMEFITDADSSDVGFPAYVAIPNSTILATYAYSIDSDSTDAFFRRRTPVSITGVRAKPEVTPALQVSPCTPNPARGSTVVGFRVLEPGPVSIRILDVRGRLTFSRTWNEQTTASHEFIVDTRGWASGVYFVQVQSREALQSQKVVVIGD